MVSPLALYAGGAAAAVAVATALLLRRYVTTEQGHHTPRTVWVTVWASWYLVFCSLTFLLPLDLDPRTRQTMMPVWEAVYWTSFGMTWVVVPLLQGYYLAGDFTPGQKLKSSLKSNAKFYGVSLVLLAAFVGYLAATSSFSGSQMLGFLVCLGNVWGLVLSVLLLGYGLVDVPRRLWGAGDRELLLEQAYYEAAGVWSQLDDCREQLADCDRTVRHVDERMEARDPLRPLLGVVRRAIPDDDETREDVRAAAHLVDIDALPDLAAVRAADRVTRPLLASLHRCVKDASRSLKLTRHHWAAVVARTERLESLVEQQYGASADELAGRAGRRTRLRAASDEGDVPIEVSGAAGALGRAARYARVRYLPRVQRAAAVLAALFSAVLVWTEVTMFSEINLSPFAHLLHAARSASTGAAAQVVAMLPLAYLSLCAVYSMFRLQLGRYYLMAPGSSDENSLLFNATYLLRLIAPIGFNFLTFMRPKNDDTAFLAVLGRMDVVPFFGTDFYVYFPMFIALFCLATVLDVYGRVLKIIGVTNFDQRSGFADEAVAEGRMYVRKELRRRRGVRAPSGRGRRGDVELG